MISFNEYKKTRKRYKLQKKIHKYYCEARPYLCVDEIMTGTFDGVCCEIKVRNLMSKDTVIDWYNVLIKRNYKLHSFAKHKIIMINKKDKTDVVILTSKQTLDKEDFAF